MITTCQKLEKLLDSQEIQIYEEKSDNYIIIITEKYKIVVAAFLFSCFIFSIILGVVIWVK